LCRAGPCRTPDGDAGGMCLSAATANAEQHQGLGHGHGAGVEGFAQRQHREQTRPTNGAVANNHSLASCAQGRRSRQIQPDRKARSHGAACSRPQATAGAAGRDARCVRARDPHRSWSPDRFQQGRSGAGRGGSGVGLRLLSIPRPGRRRRSTGVALQGGTVKELSVSSTAPLRGSKRQRSSPLPLRCSRAQSHTAINKREHCFLGSSSSEADPAGSRVSPLHQADGVDHPRECLIPQEWWKVLALNRGIPPVDGNKTRTTKAREGGSFRTAVPRSSRRASRTKTLISASAKDRRNSQPAARRSSLTLWGTPHFVHGRGTMITRPLYHLFDSSFSAETIFCRAMKAERVHDCF